MSFLLESLLDALSQILFLDGEIFRTVWTSLYTSSTAILLAALIGVPAGTALGLGRFKGRHLVLTLLNTMMALPTVVVGVVLYGFFSRQGPLGEWGLLFSPFAMIIGQMVLATPIVAHYTVSAVAGADSRIMTTALTLGAGYLRATLKFLMEIRFGIIAAVVAGFGRVIAEVGVAMMLGGNIREYTRTMTTAIALETSKGEFAFGLALGLILMAVALIVNFFLHFLQQRR